MRSARKDLIFQFKITLNGISPPIWRRVQVLATYSFWDLHVALQDSMGWLDCHLHAFRFTKKYRKRVFEIGIPDDMADHEVLPGWEISIDGYFDLGTIAVYEYDFGDGWEHEVLLEGILLKEKGVNYPRCIAGERACPPEDCGGVPGYLDLLEILGDPQHEEYESTVDWLKGHLKNYHPHQPAQFDPASVHFDNPRIRWKKAFSKSG